MKNWAASAGRDMATGKAASDPIGRAPGFRPTPHDNDAQAGADAGGTLDGIMKRMEKTSKRADLRPPIWNKAARDSFPIVGHGQDIAIAAGCGRSIDSRRRALREGFRVAAMRPMNRTVRLAPGALVSKPS